MGRMAAVVDTTETLPLFTMKLLVTYFECAMMASLVMVVQSFHLNKVLSRRVDFKYPPLCHCTPSQDSSLVDDLVVVSHVDRRDILSCLLLSTMTLLTPITVHADTLITSKLASPSAIKYLKSSVNIMSKLELYASNNDYEQVKFGLRGPGLDQLRMNAKTLVNALEPGSDQDKLSTQYTQFIQALEKLDSEASLGLRGRKNIDLWESYQKTISSLNNFIETSARFQQNNNSTK